MHPIYRSSLKAFSAVLSFALTYSCAAQAASSSQFTLSDFKNTAHECQYPLIKKELPLITLNAEHILKGSVIVTHKDAQFFAARELIEKLNPDQKQELFIFGIDQEGAFMIHAITRETESYTQFRINIEALKNNKSEDYWMGPSTPLQNQISTNQAIYIATTFSDEVELALHDLVTTHQASDQFIPTSNIGSDEFHLGFSRTQTPELELIQLLMSFSELASPRLVTVNWAPRSATEARDFLIQSNLLNTAK